MGGWDKHGSRKGGYVGGFLQLFDWKSKSRKKLFASKSDLQEQSSVRKGTEGNLPTTRFYLTDNDDETLMGSSIKGSEYSCASSMTDDDDGGYVNKAPGVVARLMGLDSLPTSYFRESYSTSPFIDSQSLRDHHRQTFLVPGTSIQEAVEIKPQKMINSPIKKFQTEILPPKSAKPIPITQNKLLSPIKSPGFVLLKDASDIMKAAAKIIDDPGLHASSSTSKSKTRLTVSSSVPLKVKDLKEKAEGVQKPSRFPKGQCRSRSSSDDLKDGVGVNNKGKSISLAVQAKVNVQKREGLSQNAIRSSSGQKDPTIKNQQNCQKKPSTNNSSTALRQNSQKQNCLVDKENIPSKPLPKVQGRRTKQADSSPGRHITSSKTIDKSKVTEHVSKSASRKNKLKEVTFHQDKNDKQISLKSATERRLTCGEDNKGKSVDVVSFTFKAPISRSMTKEKLRQASQKSVNEGGGDALSVLLEKKLKEFTHIVDSIGDYSSSSSSSSSSSISQDSVSDLESVTTTQISYDSKNQKAAQSSSPRHHHQTLQIKEEMNLEPSTMLGKHHPSPVSVLESSSLTESCNSSESTTTTITASSVQADANLSDTDSFTSRTITPTTSGWELEYIKEILSDMEPMFEEYAIGRSQHFVDPRLFHRIESAQNVFDGGDVERQTRKVLFDFVNESMDLRYRHFYYTKGGCGYEKGVKRKMKRKEWLSEEIYGELEGWRGSGDCMVDDLVEKDMSSQYGKWVEFDFEVFEVGVKIEGRILTSLIHEVVADMLRL